MTTPQLFLLLLRNSKRWQSGTKRVANPFGTKGTPSTVGECTEMLAVVVGEIVYYLQFLAQFAIY